MKKERGVNSGLKSNAMSSTFIRLQGEHQSSICIHSTDFTPDPVMASEKTICARILIMFDLIKVESDAFSSTPYPLKTTGISANDEERVKS